MGDWNGAGPKGGGGDGVGNGGAWLNVGTVWGGAWRRGRSLRDGAGLAFALGGGDWSGRGLVGCEWAGFNAGGGAYGGVWVV